MTDQSATQKDRIATALHSWFMENGWPVTNDDANNLPMGVLGGWMVRYNPDPLSSGVLIITAPDGAAMTAFLDDLRQVFFLRPTPSFVGAIPFPCPTTSCCPISWGT